MDMDHEFDIGPEDAAWRERAARFAADHVAPVARELDREARFSKDLVRAFGAAGLIGATVPEADGGGGASYLAGCLIAEELGAVDGSIRGFLAVQRGLVIQPFLDHAPPPHRERWLADLIAGEAIGACCLTEPEAGSDLGGMRTTIREDGDDVVIDGEKVWITNGNVADVLLVFGSVDPSLRTRGLECYLVPADTPGLRREPMPGQDLGHRASDHAHVVFEGVRVPRANRFGPAKGGYGVAMAGLGDGRLNVAAGAVGAHRACFEACQAFTRERRQFGKRIGDFQQVGAALADMYVSLTQSRLLVYHAARLADLGKDNAAVVSAAKLAATEAALDAAKQAIQLHGSRGYSDELPLERHYRDLVALTIYEGTSHIQRVILARHLLGKDEGPKE
ncbi:MAG: acyl-CoA dehydrogenase family protein [Planctomycetota bacterium]|nr:acyl-CoA dehydrogenase family protein [Planctomycetota bacterium]